MSETVYAYNTRCCTHIQESFSSGIIFYFLDTDVLFNSEPHESPSLVTLAQLAYFAQISGERHTSSLCNFALVTDQNFFFTILVYLHRGLRIHVNYSWTIALTSYKKWIVKSYRWYNCVQARFQITGQKTAGFPLQLNCAVSSSCWYVT